MKNVKGLEEQTKPVQIIAKHKIMLIPLIVHTIPEKVKEL